MNWLLASSLTTISAAKDTRNRAEIIRRLNAE